MKQRFDGINELCAIDYLEGGLYDRGINKRN
jgi:hypothetical protein